MAKKKYDLEDKEFVPKGDMCVNCQHIFKDCSDLEFTKMLVLKVDETNAFVKCNFFQGT